MEAKYRIQPIAKSLPTAADPTHAPEIHLNCGQFFVLPFLLALSHVHSPAKSPIFAIDLESPL